MITIRPVAATAFACTIGLCVRGASAQTCGVAGPDALVGDINGISNYTTVVGVDAFSLGETVCNNGAANLFCNANTTNHPIATMNMYRYRSIAGVGHFEQIGLGWCVHFFTALTQSMCCECNGVGGGQIGAGCSNPNTSGWNGTQCTTTAGLGPRFQVNAHTGGFVWPYQFRNNCTYIPHTNTTRRLQVATTDLNPALNLGANYFFEMQYVTPDDATAQNQDNNASYRPTMVAGVDPHFTAANSGSTQRGKPAIRAWGAIDPQVLYTNISTPESPNAGGDTTGLAILGARATDLGNGQWHYEYALFNQNSDRSFSSFAVPASPRLVVSNIGFHDVPYHSGDGYNSTPDNPITFDGTDWSGISDRSNIAWTMVPASPVDNSNALRWGTMYNFRFDCNQPSVGGTITLGLFKPAASLPDSITVSSIIPGTIPSPCPTDLNNSGGTDIDDLLMVINNWNAGAGNPADVNGSGTVNIDDLLAVINGWGEC